MTPPAVPPALDPVLRTNDPESCMAASPLPIDTDPLAPSDPAADAIHTAPLSDPAPLPDTRPMSPPVPWLLDSPRMLTAPPMSVDFAVPASSVSSEPAPHFPTILPACKLAKSKKVNTGGIRSQPGLTLSGSWEPATSPLGLKRWGFVVHLYRNLAFPLSLLKHNSRRDMAHPARRY